MLKRFKLSLILILLFCCFGYSQTVIKMKREGGVSVISCKVNGLPLDFIFDTGASDVSINMTLANFMYKNGYLSIDDILGTGNYYDANGNLSEGVQINFKSIEVAGLKLINVKASIVKNDRAPLLLGQSAINKLGKIELNLKLNTLTILKGKGVYDFSEKNNLNLSFEDYSKRGDRKFINEDYLGAVIDYTEAIKINPNVSQLYNNRGIAKISLNDYYGSIADFSQSILLNPVYSQAYKNRGQAKAELGDYTNAIIDYTTAIGINPKYFEAYNDRGTAKGKIKDYYAAISDFSKALEINPRFSQAYNNRGLAKAYLNDYQGAILDFTVAVENNPEYSDFYYNRGLSKYFLKDYYSAIEDYTKAIELTPEFNKAYFNRGIVKQLLGDKEGSCLDWRKASEFGNEKAIEFIGKFCDNFKAKSPLKINNNLNSTSTNELIDIEGNLYKTVKIGDQIWMSQNLNVSHFRNGDSIPEVVNMREWQDAWRNEKPAWCYPINLNNLGPTYGKLYNWFAVNDSRGLAPVNYKIPNIWEWRNLIDYFGNTGLAGNTIKNTGFDSPRAGYRDILTGFAGIDVYSSWWTSDISDKNDAYSILIGERWGPKLEKQGGVFGNGISVRCLRIK